MPGLHGASGMSGDKSVFGIVKDGFTKPVRCCMGLSI